MSVGGAAQRQDATIVDRPLRRLGATMRRNSGQRDTREEPPMKSERVTDERMADAPAKASINHDAPRTRLIAGVRVADNPLITAAIEYARRVSEPYLFNHAMRSWLFAETIGHMKGIDY